MKKIDIAQTITILANIGVILGIVFLAIQLQQQQRGTEVDSGYRLQESGRAVRGMIIENADIWRRGNAGEALDPTEVVIYEELIMAQWGSVFWVAVTSQSLGNDLNVPVHDFAAFLHENPAARQVWERLMAEEQSYRERLISLPVGSGLINVVLADLDLLGD